MRAVLFDVFGTVVDWHSSIINHLRRNAPAHLTAQDWPAFAQQWRSGYMRITRHVANGGTGPATVDEMHRQILDEMLASPSWSPLASVWDDGIRHDLVLGWHRLDPWPDSPSGLAALKKNYIIGTLSNGNIKLLVDMAKHAGLPWDVILSSSLFGTYKPHPDIYRGAARLLDLQPHQIIFVAAHIDDCAAARRCGFRTVYVRRPTEDSGRHINTTNVDFVVNDFEELARVLSDPQERAKL